MGGCERPGGQLAPKRRQSRRQTGRRPEAKCPRFFQTCSREVNEFDNDPSAGSPTETLLRLLLPLNAQVWESSRAAWEIETFQGPVQIPH